jgi:hypothetical protein
MVRRMLVRSMVPAALLLALPAAAAAAAPVQQDEYTMILSPAAGAVTPGATTATLVTFNAPRYLRDTRVQLSTTGLPSGVAAKFYPPAPRIGAASVLTLTAAATTSPTQSAVTVTAITLSSDPIGTSTTFDLTINGR